MPNIQLIEFLVRSGAVQFGDFTLKSGRQSPFFINTGVISDGAGTYELARHYAAKIKESCGEFDGIFGPAYKGIPLAVSISIALQKEHGINKAWISDRKEMKLHGDASSFLGAKLDSGSKLILIDDVITSGATKFEAIEKIQSGLKCETAALVIAVDRQEKAQKLSAVEEFTEQTGIPVYALVTIKEIFEYLHNRPVDGVVRVDDALYKSFMEYRKKYGV